MYRLYLLLFITQMFKTLNPYFRKHILNSLEVHEFMFINTFFVALFVFMYFIYIQISDNDFIYKFTQKSQKLSIIQIVFFIFIAFVTLCSTFIFIHLDKFYNTPFINGLLSRGMSAILLMAVGVFMFKEEYSYEQISGVFLTIFGLYLVIPKDSN